MAVKTVTVDVDVDVDLDDFDDDEIFQEAKSRGFDAHRSVWEEDIEAKQDMFRALSLGDEKKALNLLRDYLCDHLGRVL